MVTIKRLAEQDIEQLKNKKILLYSINDYDRNIGEILHCLGIEVVGHYIEQKPTLIRSLKKKIR